MDMGENMTRDVTVINAKRERSTRDMNVMNAKRERRTREVVVMTAKRRKKNAIAIRIGLFFLKTVTSSLLVNNPRQKTHKKDTFYLVCSDLTLSIAAPLKHAALKSSTPT
jgi:hypothetical protein